MPNTKKRWNNPLLQSTETETETQTVPATQPQTQTSTETQTSTFANNPFDGRHYGSEAYDQTHIRQTFWMAPEQIRRLNALKKKKRRSKAALVFEALEDLFKKYEDS